MVEVRCFRRDCKYNKMGWCRFSDFDTFPDYIEIDEEGYCVAFEEGD